MEEETRKHLRGIRILVTLALLAACISFAFTYVLFKEVSIPLNMLRTQEMQQLEKKVDSALVPRIDGKMDVELQMALVNLKEIEQATSGDLKAQASKAADEVRKVLGLLRQCQP